MYGVMQILLNLLHGIRLVADDMRTVIRRNTDWWRV
jgi:hypothetical protein